jgi:hypothetical protein
MGVGLCPIDSPIAHRGGLLRGKVHEVGVLVGAHPMGDGEWPNAPCIGHRHKFQLG